MKMIVDHGEELLQHLTVVVVEKLHVETEPTSARDGLKQLPRELRLRAVGRDLIILGALETLQKHLGNINDQIGVHFGLEHGTK